jgi:hypothetical protein
MKKKINNLTNIASSAFFVILRQSKKIFLGLFLLFIILVIVSNTVI